MTSTGHLTSNHHEIKEFDSMKESISDIINQLQDIDPARLSFSPFLDLDTQISLAPVSDSPESSVEELHSPSHSVPGSQHSLEPPSTADNFDRDNSYYNQSYENFAVQPRHHASKQDVKKKMVMNDACIMAMVDSSNENCSSYPLQAFQNDILTDRHVERRNPLESTNLDSTMDEGSPLIRTPRECIELAVLDSQGEEESEGISGAVDRGQCCCRCCLSGRVPALCSALAALFFLPWILYALYVYLPLDTPYCPDVYSRLTFTLRCCTVAALPILLAMISSTMSRFCSASLDPVGDCPRRCLLLQMFVASSIEQLFLYALNLAVMATFLHQDQLKAVPILSGVFVGGRFVYWLSLHICSTWRGFGSGLTVFPLLAMVVFNLYCLFDLGLRQFFDGSEDTLPIHATPTSWPRNTAEQLNDRPTLCPSTQKDRGYC